MSWVRLNRRLEASPPPRHRCTAIRDRLRSASARVIENRLRQARFSLRDRAGCSAAASDGHDARRSATRPASSDSRPACDPSDSGNPEARLCAQAHGAAFHADGTSVSVNVVPRRAGLGAEAVDWHWCCVVNYYYLCFAGVVVKSSETTTTCVLVSRRHKALHSSSNSSSE